MADNTKSTTLPRVLGLTSSLFMVVGIMIGTGIFKKITPMAQLGLSESAIIGAWIVAGVITMLGALSVSALTGLSEESGGQYEYIRIIYGKFIAFLFGWSCFTIIGSASAAAMSMLFVQSLKNLFPFPFFENAWVLKCLTCAIIVLLTLINIRSTKVSSRLINLLTVGKVLGVVMLIVGGLFLFNGNNTTAFSKTTPDVGNIFSNSYMTVFFAAMLSAFWAYDGWLNVSFMSGEIKNAKRHVATAIVGGTLLVMCLYVLTNLAYLRVLPLEKFSQVKEGEIAASYVSDILFGPKGSVLLMSLILISALGSANGNIITYSRMYYKMASDGLFFNKVSNIHAKYQTPHIALWATMCMSCVMVFWGNFDQLTDMIVFAGFIFYGMLALGVILMKRKGRVEARRIGYPFVPVLFTLASAGLLINTLITQPWQSLAGVGLICTGLPFYFLFKGKQAE